MKIGAALFVSLIWQRFWRSGSIAREAQIIAVMISTVFKALSSRPFVQDAVHFWSSSLAFTV